MNKSLIKFIADFGPLLIFFIVYTKSGNNLSLAIPPLVIATIVAVIVIYFLERKIPYVPLIGAIIITLFGGLTIYFNNPIFIYLKPTLVNLIFAFILLVGNYFFKKNFIKIMLQSALKLDEEGWSKLNNSTLVFASEIKGILGHPEIKSEFNREYVLRSLPISSPETIFNGFSSKN